MPTCPRCHQSVNAQAVSCPHCRLVLKAHGHPSIPIYRASDREYLCQTCTYDEDDTCNFPQRPYATECTLYCDRRVQTPLLQRSAAQTSLNIWLRHNGLWLVLLAIVLASLLIALSGR